METFRDKARACLFALLVHLGVIGVLLIGLVWAHESTPVSLPGPVIQAELVGITAAPTPKSASRPKPTPPKPAQPEPTPPPAPTPTPPPQRNDQMDREKIAEMAQEKAENAKRAEEERIKQQQVLLEDQQRKERERAKELEQIKKELADARRKSDLEKQKLAQMDDYNKKQAKAVAEKVPEAEQARTGMAGKDDSLQAQYFAAIQNAVTNNWLRPDNTPGGVRCMLRIVQIPGGEVIGVQIANPCNADPQTRTSIEQAVKRAAPLPYKGYEQVFSRDINFNFTYDG